MPLTPSVPIVSDSPQTPPFFLAGHPAPAGTYTQVGGPREVRLDQEDVLPATCDGHVAVYVRRASWADRGGRGEERH